MATVKTTITVDADRVEAVKVLARQEGRSLSNMIDRLVWEALTARHVYTTSAKPDD